MITKLRRLWQQAFGDTDDFLDAFFSLAYAPERCRFLTEDGEITAALYWFDCSVGDRKLAYLYAIATDKDWRGRGLCRELMAQTHAHLAANGYAGTVLVPGSPELFRLYEKLGYRTFGYVQEFSCTAGQPIPLQPVDTMQYAHLRRQLLPEGGVVQEGGAMALLSTQAQFYAGDGFVLAATCTDSGIQVHELLGHADPSGIVAALGTDRGNFRVPGREKPFAMYHSLSQGDTPGYFGLALD